MADLKQYHCCHGCCKVRFNSKENPSNSMWNFSIQVHSWYAFVAPQMVKFHK
jgi:hypothetical protein